MPDTPNKFYLTTPIYYVNARPHIGHAYSTIAADVIARRHRLLGDDTFFLTGTDEHGQKVQRSAAAAGIAPQQFADQVSKSFEDLWKRMGITNDDYIRTTDERHKRGVQHLWRVLEERGAIYLSSYTGQYCVSDEAFVDVPVGAPCPTCGRTTETITEENYFFKLSEHQKALIELIETDELNIRPDSARNEVLSFLTGNTTWVLDLAKDKLDLSGSFTEDEFERLDPPDRFELAYVNGLLGKTQYGTFYNLDGLKDLSISRTTFDWGIPVPTNPKHVVYVWLDALANYITAIGYGSDSPADKEKFERYWPADIHLVGKEITRFHCVYWPAFLMAAGIATPKSVVANGWLLFEESKMSKSRGNVVRTETILDAFGPLCPPMPPLLSSRSEAEGSASPEAPHSSTEAKDRSSSGLVTRGFSPESLAESTSKEAGALAPGLAAPTKAQQDLFAADVLRYFLLREIPFGADGSFSFDALITRYTADLTNGYGNLVSRALSLIEQNFPDGIPACAEPWLCVETHSASEELDPDFIKSGPSTNFVSKMMGDFEEKFVGRYFRDYSFHVFLAELSFRTTIVDGYISFHKPWVLAKRRDADSKAKLAEILYTAAESIRIITALLYPVMPYATASVWCQLGLDPAQLTTNNQQLATVSWGGLRPGTKLGPLTPIFPRADKGLAQIMTDMENPTTPAAAEPAKPSAKSSEPTAEALNAVNPTSAPATENVQRTTDNAAAPPSGPSTITIDDFAKVDLRVAQIVVAERIPKADKLLRLEVDLGPNFDPPRRQILAGIAEHYAPEALIGRKVVIVANLAPRKMRGLESQGMIVAASVGPNGAPVLVGFAEDVELGARLK